MSILVFQGVEFCFKYKLPMEKFANISYLVRTKGLQSRPNLSKQRLDQKSKDGGAILSLYTLVIQ